MSGVGGTEKIRAQDGCDLFRDGISILETAREGEDWGGCDDRNSGRKKVKVVAIPQLVKC